MDDTNGNREGTITVSMLRLEPKVNLDFAGQTIRVLSGCSCPFAVSLASWLVEEVYLTFSLPRSAVLSLALPISIKVIYV